MSMRSIRSDLKDSRFVLKLGLSPAPLWKRRAPPADASRDLAPQEFSGRRIPSGPGERVRRSEQVDPEAVKRGELANLSSDKGDT